MDARIARSCARAEERFCSNLQGSLERLLSQAGFDSGAAPDPDVALHDLKFECLVEHKSDPKMEPECRAAIEHFQILSE